jgi:hypothetical protein
MSSLPLSKCQSAPRVEEEKMKVVSSAALLISSALSLSLSLSLSILALLPRSSRPLQGHLLAAAAVSGARLTLITLVAATYSLHKAFTKIYYNCDQIPETDTNFFMIWTKLKKD